MSGKRISAFAKRAQLKNKKKQPLSIINSNAEQDLASKQSTIEDSIVEEVQNLRKAVLPIQLTISELRPIAYRIFTKKYSLNLKSSGLEKLALFLGRRYGIEWRGAKAEKFMDQAAKLWKSHDRGLFVDGEQLEMVIREVIDLEDGTSIRSSLSRNFKTDTESLEGAESEKIKVIRKTDIDWQNYFKTINAYSQPKYIYDSTRKLYELVPSPSKPLGSSKSRTNVFSTRYHAVLARIQRQESFQAPTFLGKLAVTGEREPTTHTITMIKNMLGREGKGFIIYGLLTKGANGKYWLQDSSGTIELDIDTHAIPAQGSYYVPGCLCICDGIYSRDKFIVLTIGSPTCESRNEARAACGYLDFLGLYMPEDTKYSTSVPIRVDRSLESKLAEEEMSALQDHRMIILGCDIFLDKLSTIDGLRKLFTRLEIDRKVDGTTPVCIILLGSFVSTPFQPVGSSSSYKDSFDNLASLLQEFPELINSSESPVKIVFIPGDNDPWASTFSSGAATTWPSKSLPQVFTNRLRRMIPGAEFTSNPTRLAYMSQELTIVRDDLGARLRRNQIIFPEVERRRAGIYSDELTNKMDEINLNGENNRNLDALMLDELQNSTENDAESEINDLESMIIDVEEDRETEGLARRNMKLKKLLETDKNVRPMQESLHVDPEVAEARKVVKTVLDQGTLSPFQLTVRPVFWEYEHTLSITPLPNSIILADPTSPPFKVTYQGCTVVNPGSLIRDHQIHWIEYTPSTRQFNAKSLFI